MNRRRRLARLWRRLLLGGLLLLVAVILGLRLLLPQTELYRPRVEQLLSAYVGQAVSIEALQASWRGLSLELQMRGVKLLDRSGRETVFRLDRAAISLSPLASVRAGRVLLGSMTVYGAFIAITRQADGSFVTEGLEPDASRVGSAARAASRAAFGNWVLNQSELELESATVVWTDHATGGDPLTLTGVSLRTGFDGAAHTLAGAASLPPEIGESLDIDVRIEGDPRSSKWSGHARLGARAVDIAALSGMHRALAVRQASGSVSFEVDMLWERARLARTTGEVDARDLGLRWTTGESRFQNAAGRFELQRTSTGWELELEDTTLSRRQGPSPPLEGHLTLTRDPVDGGAELTGSLSLARVEDLVPLVAARLPARLQPALVDLGATGGLSRVQFVARGQGEGLQALEVEANFEDLATRPRGRIPAMAGLSGRLEANLMGGRLTLNSDSLRLELPGVFEFPLDFRDGVGAIGWTRRGSGWWFETEGLRLTNEDISGQLSGKLHWPYGNQLPIVDLNVAIDSADLSHLEAFVPTGVLPPRLARWLGQAIQGGKLHHANARFRGYAGDFPFKGARDSFLVRGEVSGVELDYAAGWPPLTDLESELTIAGPTLEIRATAGTIFGAAIDGAIATIDDLRIRPSSLTVRGDIRGSAREGLRFLRESRLKRRFEPLVRHADASGEVAVSLDLAIPLPPGKAAARGNIRLAGNALELKGTGLEFADVNGVLDFSPTGVSVENLVARYLGQPVAVRVARHPADPTITRVEVSGAATPEFLTEQLRAFALFRDPADAPRIVSMLHGETPWRATLDLPDAWGRTDTVAPLSIESDLVGLELRLPAPFTKAANEPGRFAVETALTGTPQRLVTIRFGEEIGSRLELRREGSEYQLLRGSVAFGDPSPALPSGRGLHIGGKVEALSIDDWAAMLREEASTPAAAPSSDPPRANPFLRALSKVDVRTDALELLGRALGQVQLRMMRGEVESWVVRADGEDIAGSITLPASLREDPLTINLERLRLKAGESSRETPTYDPRRIPAIELSCRNLIYEDRSLGAVELATSRQPNGVRIDSASLKGDGFSASAAGSWSLRDGQPRSEFSSELRADDLGNLLSLLSQRQPEAASGTTEVAADLGWPGAPSDFDLEHLGGTLHFRATDGRLAEMDPGATGRAFGLMMITALPRRLRLDFSDLFDEGIRYELIEGSFALEGGDAFTNNLLLESESARIELSGRTGLVDRDYDQIITITPKLSSSLPLAPIWLIEKMLNRQMFDKAFAFQYVVTGSWEDPVVDRVAVESTAKDRAR